MTKHLLKNFLYLTIKIIRPLPAAIRLIRTAWGKDGSYKGILVHFQNESVQFMFYGNKHAMTMNNEFFSYWYLWIKSFLKKYHNRMMTHLDSSDGILLQIWCICCKLWPWTKNIMHHIIHKIWAWNWKGKLLILILICQIHNIVNFAIF